MRKIPLFYFLFFIFFQLNYLENLHFYISDNLSFTMRVIDSLLKDLCENKKRDGLKSSFEKLFLSLTVE